MKRQRSVCLVGPSPRIVRTAVCSGSIVLGVTFVPHAYAEPQEADGTARSFRRNGDVPKVDVRDPLEAHRNLLPVYTDKDIHDVTAYLAGVK